MDKSEAKPFFWKQKLLGFIAWTIYRSLRFTWRVTIIEPPSIQERMNSREPFILAHWHGDELVLLSVIGYYRIATLVSTSKDGEIMTTVVRLVGGLITRGSSTRGAVGGLLGLVRLIKQKKRNTSFAVDGPKGPLHKVKSGVFEMSRLLKSAPIYPAGVYCDRAWRFPKSWNQTYMPKPFARVIIYWGEPMTVSADEDPRSEELRLKLENALRNSHEVARKKIAAP